MNRLSSLLLDLRRLPRNAIIGNPPYQLTGGSGGTNDSPIYQLFCSLGFNLSSTYSSFIIPSRWFSAGRDVLLGDFRKLMLTCGKISYLNNTTNSRLLFPTVEIKGGVCYYLYNSKHIGKCHYIYTNNGETISKNIILNRFDILIRDPRIAEIVDKVNSQMKKESCVGIDSIFSGDTPFGIPTNVLDSSKNPFMIFAEESPEHDVKVYYLEKGKRKIAFTSNTVIKKNSQDIDKVKVFLPKASGSGNDPNVIGEPILAECHSVCSQTFIYAAFKNVCEAKNFMSYIKTKFARILISSIKLTQDCLSGVFRFVPLQDFTRPWTDSALYAKYNLTSDEISFIEKVIKPME